MNGYGTIEKNLLNNKKDKSKYKERGTRIVTTNDKSKNDNEFLLEIVNFMINWYVLTLS